jgi:carboxymethylenebutenolidase
MGQRVEFPSNGHTSSGYLATPASGKGPAIVVIQEWWGLVPHIEDIVERFAKEGFLAIAPDLFHGKTTKSPDEAGKLVMELDAERAAKEIIAAGESLLQRPECSSKTYGVVGFCMGGGLAKFVATKDPKVSAAASFYGGFKKVDTNWENLRGALLLIAGEKDKGVPPEGERALAEKLKAMGKNVTVKTYPDANHAFFNDTRPEVYNADAARDAWKTTLELFRANVK